MRYHRTLSHLLTAFFLALLLSGCGGGSSSSSTTTTGSTTTGSTTTGSTTTGSTTTGSTTTGSTKNEFVYVTNQGDNTVSAYSLNTTTGSLTPISGSPFKTGNSPSVIASTPNGNFLYITNGNNAASTQNGTISAYNINPQTGVLSPISGSPFQAGVNPIGVTTDQTGKFLYVVNNGGTSGQANGNIYIYNIDPSSGALSNPRQVASFQSNLHPGVISISPNGNFAYVTVYNGTGGNAKGFVYVYSINSSDGSLALVQTAQAGIDPADIAIAPQGNYAFVTNNGDNTISIYKIDPTTGQLNQIQGSPFPSAGDHPGGITINSQGTSIYVANGGSNTITNYSLNPQTGNISYTNASTGNNPIMIAINPEGKFAYVTNQSFSSSNVPGNISAYSINPSDGTLTPINGSPFNAGSEPTFVAIVQTSY